MMKRIAKGPVKGISLKLQEEVRVCNVTIVGKREKDGLHPREIRASGGQLGNQGQRRKTDGQGSRP